MFKEELELTNGETMVAEINNLDEKGSGQAVIWRENEQGNPKKLRLTIPQTLPGEKVRVTVDQPERRRRKAMADEIMEAHPERTASACLHFEKCGGCVWQHWTTKVNCNKKQTM